MGFRPRPFGAARLDGYAIKIGERATLERAAGKAADGFLHDLLQEEASALYSRPEVRGYVPQPVQATLLADCSLHQAICYVLPWEEAGTIPNRAYAVKLAALVSGLGLPAEYAREIATIGEIRG